MTQLQLNKEIAKQERLLVRLQKRAEKSVQDELKAERKKERSLKKAAKEAAETVRQEKIAENKREIRKRISLIGFTITGLHFTKKSQRKYSKLVKGTIASISYGAEDGRVLYKFEYTINNKVLIRTVDLKWFSGDLHGSSVYNPSKKVVHKKVHISLQQGKIVHKELS